MAELDRFVAAQDRVYADALAELRRGRKQTHWMWFVFPQIAGLGMSDMSRRFAIASRAEAAHYLAHPMLGPRLADCTDAVLAHEGTRSAEAIFGGIDAVKLRSSMTLFDAVATDGRFRNVLDGFFDGAADPATSRLLAATGDRAS